MIALLNFGLGLVAGLFVGTLVLVLWGYYHRRYRMMCTYFVAGVVKVGNVAELGLELMFISEGWEIETPKDLERLRGVIIDTVREQDKGSNLAQISVRITAVSLLKRGFGPSQFVAMGGTDRGTIAQLKLANLRQVTHGHA